jgi:hypothetical protein
MAITGLPTFVDKEVPTFTKLNLLTSVLANKFAGGITGADLKYPFQLAGNLDLNGYTVVNFGSGLANVRFASAFASIQDAVDDLGSGGGIVFVPAGTFTLPSTLEMASSTSTGYSRVSIVGSGYSTVLKAATGFTAGNSVVRMAKPGFGSEYMQLANCLIDCNSQGNVQGIHAGGTSNSSVSNVFVINCTTINMTATKASSLRLNAVNLTGGAVGVDIEQDTGSNGPYYFNNCIFHNQTSSCIVANWYGSLSLTNCFMTPSGSGTTFSIVHSASAQAKQLSIIDCISDGGGGAVITCQPPCSNITVANNVFANSTGSGLRVALTGTLVETRGLSFLGNLFYHSSDTGLQLTGGPAGGVAVVGNTFYENVTAGGEYQLKILGYDQANSVHNGTIVGNTFQKGSGGFATGNIALASGLGNTMTQKFVITGNVGDQATNNIPIGNPPGHLLGVNIFG